MTVKSPHIDTFAKDNLPPASQWPEMNYSGVKELEYTDQLNCATELLDNMVAKGFAESPLFHTPEEVITYGAFLAETNKIARVLTEDLGLVPGNRVLLRGPNCPQMAACWFAVIKAGGICVTTMPLLREVELSYMVKKAQITHCLCDSRFADEIKLTEKATPELTHVAYFGSDEQGSIDQLMSSKDSTFENVLTAADDTALIGFTSGTTGKAKATMHFHRDVMAICDIFPRYALEASSEDVFCGTPPFGFTFGLGALLLFPMRFGASVALLEKPDLEGLLKIIQDVKATICFTSPTAYRGMLEFADNYDLSSLKKCVSAGEPLPLPSFEAWHQATGIKIIDGIGATELLHIFISTTESDIRPGATGKPLPGYEAKVVNEKGAQLPAGEVGLLAVRGPTGCRYLCDDRQQKYVQDGWNLTGDAYSVDKDGYFWFQSRADDMIISSGYNISGVEIERVLLAHPKVSECGVVGVSDKERGHIVKAFIVLRDSNSEGTETTKELQDFVKAEVAPYKYPRAIDYLSALPKTETGKLQRFKLREMG